MAPMHLLPPDGPLLNPGAPITLAKAQSTVDAWIRATKAGYFPVVTNVAILAEEVGEVARIAVRLHGEQTSKPSEVEKMTPQALSDELADVLWVVLALANQTGTDLSAAFARTVAKKASRDAGRH